MRGNERIFSEDQGMDGLEMHRMPVHMYSYTGCWNSHDYRWLAGEKERLRPEEPIGEQAFQRN